MKIEIRQSVQTKKRTFNFTQKELGFNFFRAFTDKKKKNFYREFSTLIRASIDFNKALELLAQQEKSKKIKAIYQNITHQVVKGKGLHEALGAHRDFTKYEIYSIRIGEESRRLPEVLDQLEKFYTRKIKMKRQIVSVMSYPSFVLLITFAVLYFMLSYVVPMFSTVFRQFGGELPPITVFVQKLAGNFNMVLGILFSTFFLLLLVHFYFRNNENYKEAIGNFVLKIPVFGKLIRKIAVAKFFQAMGLLLSAKTPLLVSLDLSRAMMDFYPLKKTIAQANVRIRRGSSLSNALHNKKLFQQKEITMLSIGEEVNELDSMFNKLTEQLEDDIEHEVKLISTILEPVMIILIGVVVGFILIAMYYPMFSLGNVINT